MENYFNSRELKKNSSSMWNEDWYDDGKELPSLHFTVEEEGDSGL